MQASSPSDGGSLVTRTARALAELSLAREAGAYLGAEDELLARLGVSRPTLRQAAKIVETDRLISVRRGVKGGFYAERPDAKDAIRALAQFLRLKGASITDMMVVTRMVAEEAASLAAEQATDAQRADLLDFVHGIDANDSPSELVQAEGRLARLLAAMSGNPAIQLVMEIGYTFGMGEPRLGFYASAEDRAAARRLQHGLCRAVLDGDGDVARVMMRRRSALIDDWIARARAETGREKL